MRGKLGRAFAALSLVVLAAVAAPRLNDFRIGDSRYAHGHSIVAPPMYDSGHRNSAIAIACLRLVTFLPELPLLSVPRLRLCIALFTLLCAFFP